MSEPLPRPAALGKLKALAAAGIVRAQLAN